MDSETLALVDTLIQLMTIIMQLGQPEAGFANRSLVLVERRLPWLHVDVSSLVWSRVDHCMMTKGQGLVIAW